jgi:E3 ubiquitin-protein ligase RFWD3
MSYSYCAPCDLYFVDDHFRDQHVKYSDNHPECHFCGRHFLNNHILRNHKVVEENHFYCGDCDKDFDSAGAIQVHLKFDPAHCDPSNPELKAKCREYDVDINEERWEYELARELYPCGDGVDFSWKEERLRELEEAFGEGWDYADYYDHELVEYLEESPAYSYGEDSDSEEDDEDEDDEGGAHKFTCPMCLEEDPKTICATSCGHLFCATCAVGALKYTHQCPECDEPGEVCELRRVYVSDD